MVRAVLSVLAAAALLIGCKAQVRPPVGADDGSIPLDAPGACNDALPVEPASTPFALRYDQIGYAWGGRLWAVVVGQGEPAPAFRIYATATRCFVGDGVAGPRVLDARSRAGTALTGDRVDLSAIPGPGEYLVVLADGARFGPIVVADDPHEVALSLVSRFLRSQRCGATTAEASHHGACHLHASLTDGDRATASGDGVAVDDGYRGDVSETTGPAVDGEGGWHDAGDYIKFLGTTSFTLAVDLIALRDRGAALKRRLGAAPVEELRTELRWGLDWVVKMIGGDAYYHQVSGERDHQAGFRKPDDDTEHPVRGYAHRPVFRLAPGRGGNLLGRAAAALAAGSEVYADDPPYAARLLEVARRAYAEGKRRMMAQSPDPTDFYGEGSVTDDLALGAAVLARVTGEAAYRADALTYAQGLDPDPGSPIYWGGVDALALIETALAFADGSPERAAMATKLAALAAPIEASDGAPRGPGAAFGYALADFGNGTIEQSLGAAAVCLAARRLGGHDACVEVARSQLHWLYGQNPFGVSFQIGAGKVFPHHPHHALVETAGFVLEGAIVGGPTGIDVIRGDLPVPGPTAPFAKWSTDDLFYEDVVDNWVVNEPAIDFSAPLVYVVAELPDGD